MRSTVECGLVGTCATYLARYTRGFHWHPSVLECNWWGVHGRKWTSYGWQLGLVWSQAQLYRFIPEDRFWLIKIKFTAVHRRHGRNVHLALLSDSYDTHRLTFGLDRIQYNSWSEVGECRPLLRPLSSWVLLVMEAFVWIFFYHWNGYFCLTVLITAYRRSRNVNSAINRVGEIRRTLRITSQEMELRSSLFEDTRYIRLPALSVALSQPFMLSWGSTPLDVIILPTRFTRIQAIMSSFVKANSDA